MTLNFKVGTMPARKYHVCRLRKTPAVGPDTTPVARRAAVQLVLDDPAFMRGRKGVIPARVISDAEIEAMLRLSREGSALAEQIALVDKTIAEIKK